MKKDGPTWVTTNPSRQSIKMPAFAKPAQLPDADIREIEDCSLESSSTSASTSASDRSIDVAKRSPPYSSCSTRDRANISCRTWTRFATLSRVGPAPARVQSTCESETRTMPCKLRSPGKAGSEMNDRPVLRGPVARDVLTPACGADRAQLGVDAALLEVTREIGEA